MSEPDHFRQSDEGQRHGMALSQQDPTALTTQLMLRELSSLKAVLDERFDSFAVRLAAMDKAQALFETNLTRVPTEVDKAISHLKELHDKKFNERFETVSERFQSVQTQFRERDVRVEESAKATSIAVGAALAAQEKSVAAQNDSFKESIEKSERAFEKNMDALRLTIETMTGGFHALLSDAKGRLDRLEGITLGSATTLATHQVQKQDTQGSQANLIALVALVITIVGLIIAFIVKH